VHAVNLALCRANMQLTITSSSHFPPSWIQAFSVNLYNLMIKYAFIKVGVASTKVTRATFYTSVKFNIGGYLYTFQDWENGIIRGNEKAPHGFSVPFGKKDPRLHFMVQKPDARIHFALNCGAKSCPPVTTLSAENLDEELSMTAFSFCEDDHSVYIDTKHREVRLSKIFQWYKSDFTDQGVNGLPVLLSERYVKGMKKQTLDRLIENGNVKVSFGTYDWSTMTLEHLDFEPDSLNTTRSRVRSLFGSSSPSPMKQRRPTVVSSPSKVKGKKQDSHKKHSSLDGHSEHSKSSRSSAGTKGSLKAPILSPASSPQRRSSFTASCKLQRSVSASPSPTKGTPSRSKRHLKSDQ
jgi:Protein of unknown function, DUF547